MVNEIIAISTFDTQMHPVDWSDGVGCYPNDAPVFDVQVELAANAAVCASCGHQAVGLPEVNRQLIIQSACGTVSDASPARFAACLKQCGICPGDDARLASAKADPPNHAALDL